MIDIIDDVTRTLDRINIKVDGLTIEPYVAPVDENQAEVDIQKGKIPELVIGVSIPL